LRFYTACPHIDANFPSPVRVNLNGKEFSGDWKESKIYEVGNAQDQLHQGTANLKANDGSEMACNFKYRSALESGACSLNGEVFKLHKKVTKHIN